MPSTPAADSPYPESQLKREGLVPSNLPGMPSTAGKAGGVQAGRFSYPNPPSPDKAQPGRPPTSAGPVPGVVPPPTTSPATPGTGSSQSQQEQPTAQAVPQQEEQPYGAGQGGAPVDPTQQDKGGLAGMPINMARMPRPGEVPPGSVVQTPFGTVEDDGQGGSKLSLSPEGTQRYKEAKAALRKKLGAMPAGLDRPGMPEFPVELGQYNYNPFTGKMERG